MKQNREYIGYAIFVDNKFVNCVQGFTPIYRLRRDAKFFNGDDIRKVVIRIYKNT